MLFEEVNYIANKNRPLTSLSNKEQYIHDRTRRSVSDKVAKSNKEEKAKKPQEVKSDKNDQDENEKFFTWDNFRKFIKLNSDEAFDSLMSDNIKTTEEREKIQKLIDKGIPKSEIFKAGLLHGVAGQELKPKEYFGKFKNSKTQKSNNSEMDSDIQADIGSHKFNDKTYTRTKIPTLSGLELKSVENRIINSSKQDQRLIYKKLVDIYNKMGKPVKENFEYINLNKKLLSDLQIKKLLDSVYNIFRKANKNIKEEESHKIPNNIVSRKWVQIGKPRSKEKLIKLMRYFKLNDDQISRVFERIQSPFTIDEINRYKLDLKYNINKKLTIQDLEKFSNTLGKLKLKKFLTKLKSKYEGK